MLLANTTSDNLTWPGISWHGVDKSIPLAGAPDQLFFYSPRVGLAYDLYGTGKTVFRGGFGIYWSRDSYNNVSKAASTAIGVEHHTIQTTHNTNCTLDQLFNAAPINATPTGSQVLTCGYYNGAPAFNSGATPLPGSGSIGAINALNPKDNQQPVTYNYNFTLDQKLPKGTSMEIAYVGNQTHNIITVGILQNKNVIPLGAYFSPAPIIGQTESGTTFGAGSIPSSYASDYRPYPNYQQVNVADHTNWANYNALQASINKQSGALIYGVNYTWSKTMAVRGNYDTGQGSDRVNPLHDYGVTSYDRPQAINFTYSYQEGKKFHGNRILGSVLNYWEISGKTSIQSGPDLSVILGTSYSFGGTATYYVGQTLQQSYVSAATWLGTNDYILQPTITCDPGANLHAQVLAGSTRVSQQFVNGNCFGVTKPGTQGWWNLPDVHGPAFSNSDLSLYKSAGDVFIGNIIYCCGASYELMEETPGQTTGTALLTNIVNPITSIAIDAANNIYYTDTSGKLLKLAYSGGAYASAPVLFGGSFNNAIGVTTDNAGNLYVTDAGAFTIYEIPYETSALNPADKFVIVNLTSLHNQSYGAGTDLEIASPSVVDAAGNIYFTESASPTGGGTPTASAAEVTRGNAVFASSAVGVASSATLNVVFNAPETPKNFNFVTETGVSASATCGSCVAGSFYAINANCTINASFTPTVPGDNSGTIALADSTGATIASAFLSSTGLGAGLTVDPGEAVAFGSGYKTPTSVAIDLFGDVFFADSGKSQVLEVLPGNATPVVIGSGLNAPTGVAVDAAGNVYIADTGNDQIVKVPFVKGALSSSAQSVFIASTTSIAGAKLSAPSGLSVDTGGNLYIADTGNNRVVYLPQYGNGNVAGAFKLGAGFSRPLATTVTSSGLIYIADTGNGNIYSLPYAAAAAPKSLVATGYIKVTALATDPAGDLFIVDTGKQLISRIPNSDGALATASAFNITGTIANPYGVVLNAIGNLYATDNVVGAAYLVSRTSATQDFGKWNQNTTSSSLSFLLENSGNQALMLASPFETLTGNTANFTLVTSPNSPCTNSGTVAIGADCIVASTFTPSSLTTYSETFNLNSNAKNTSTFQATFTGTGTTVLSTKTTLSITSPMSNPYYTQPIQLAVTVTASSGTPVGSVALLVDGLKYTTAVLSNGATTFTLPAGLTGSTHTLQANYLGGTVGSTNYSQSQSSVVNTTVTRVATTTAVSVQTPYILPQSQQQGQGVSLTAIVSSAITASPSGTVTFVINDPAGSPQSVTVPLVLSAAGVLEANYVYIPLAPATGTTFDLVSVSASYSGDGNFTGSSTTAPATFAVSPSTGSVGVAPSGYTITASASGSTAITFTASSYGGWNGYTGFHCIASSLPANALCAFSPGQLQVQSSNASGTYVGVMLVNKDPEQTATVKVTFKGGVPGAAGKRFEYGNAQFTAGAQLTVTPFTDGGAEFSVTVPLYSVTDIVLPAK